MESLIILQSPIDEPFARLVCYYKKNLRSFLEKVLWWDISGLAYFEMIPVAWLRSLSLIVKIFSKLKKVKIQHIIFEVSR